MPTYNYVCDACGVPFEDFRSISKPHPATCPHCAEPFGTRFRQDYSGVGAVAVVYGNPTTFGQQAEINARRLGKEQMQQMEQSSRPGWSGPLPAGAQVVSAPAGRPWFRDGVAGTKVLDKPLDLSKVPDIQRYVETGK